MSALMLGMLLAAQAEAADLTVEIRAPDGAILREGRWSLASTFPIDGGAFALHGEMWKVQILRIPYGEAANLCLAYDSLAGERVAGPCMMVPSDDEIQEEGGWVNALMAVKP